MPTGPKVPMKIAASTLPVPKGKILAKNIKVGDNIYAYGIVLAIEATRTLRFDSGAQITLHNPEHIYILG
jgi:hypothetical protein